jgi:hypothetical protein
MAMQLAAKTAILFTSMPYQPSPTCGHPSLTREGTGVGHNSCISPTTQSVLLQISWWQCNWQPIRLFFSHPCPTNPPTCGHPSLTREGTGVDHNSLISPTTQSVMLQISWWQCNWQPIRLFFSGPCLTNPPRPAATPPFQGRGRGWVIIPVFHLQLKLSRHYSF